MGKGKRILAKFVGMLPSELVKKVAVISLTIDLRVPFATGINHLAILKHCIALHA